jgi:hypothetical protein
MLRPCVCLCLCVCQSVCVCVCVSRALARALSLAHTQHPRCRVRDMDLFEPLEKQGEKEPKKQGEKNTHSAQKMSSD